MHAGPRLSAVAVIHYDYSKPHGFAGKGPHATAPPSLTALRPTTYRTEFLSGDSTPMRRGMRTNALALRVLLAASEVQRRRMLLAAASAPQSSRRQIPRTAHRTAS